ncbi:MAG: stalk domain-containing protein [Bacillota bacterium]
MKNLRLLASLLIVIFLCSVLSVSAFAAESSVKVKTVSVTLQFDGQVLKLPEGQHSFIYQGRTYVPIRYISYALQKSVKWDGVKASISEPTEEELAVLKKQLQGVTAGNQTPQANVEINIQPVKATLEFDGEIVALPAGQALFGYKGAIYAPLRFLSESVGTVIDWDPVTKTVSAESEAYRMEHGTEDDIVLPGTSGAVEGGGAGSGAVSVKLTYEQITAEAEAKLTSLRNSCKAALMNIALQYVAADDAGKANLKARGLQEMDSCTSKFEVIMTDTSAKLTANGYSTAIIAEYRAAYNEELEAGRAIAEGLA